MSEFKPTDFKKRIMEERELLRKALLHEHGARRGVYEASEALKRIEDTIVSEIADNTNYKNEKQRTEAKRMARINDSRYIAGLKEISDREIERINVQASIIDHQTRIQVFTADYEFSLLGRRDAQQQFTLQLAKVIQADTTTAIEVTAPKLTSTPNITETEKMSVNQALQHVDADKGRVNVVPSTVNPDFIFAFMDTTEGRAVVADWLREHHKPVMADALQMMSAIPGVRNIIAMSDERMLRFATVGAIAQHPTCQVCGVPLVVFQLEDVEGDTSTQFFHADNDCTANKGVFKHPTQEELEFATSYVVSQRTAQAQLKLGCPPEGMKADITMPAQPRLLDEKSIEAATIATDRLREAFSDNDPNKPTSQGNNPAVNIDLPEGVELKAGIPVCKNCGMMLEKIQPGQSGDYPHAIGGLYVHPNNSACAAVESAHPDAVLRKSEGKKGQRIGGVDV